MSRRFILFIVCRFDVYLYAIDMPARLIFRAFIVISFHTAI